MKGISFRIQQFFLLTTYVVTIWSLMSVLVNYRMGSLYGIFRRENTFQTVGRIGWLSFFIALVLIVVLWILGHVARKYKMSDKCAFFLLIIEILVLSVGTHYFLRKLGYDHLVDDSGIVYRWMTNFHQINPWKNGGIDQYFYANPQNMFLALIYRLIMALFGSNFCATVSAFFMIHAATIVLLFKTLRRLKLNNVQALLLVQIYFFAIQLTLHSVLAYTDTLALFFIVVSLFFFSGFVDQHKPIRARRWNFIWTNVFAVIGFIGKGTMLIYIIALSLYLALTTHGKTRLLSIVPMVFLVVGNLGWHAAINSSGVYSDSNFGQPNTHYVMMGIDNTPIPKRLDPQQKQLWSVGIYEKSEQDYSWHLLYDKQLSKKSVEKKQLKIYKTRLTSMNFSQLLEAINNKISVVYGSGDAKVTFSLLRASRNQIRADSILTSDHIGKLLYIIMTIAQLLIYISIIAACVFGLKHPDSLLFLGGIFISGYFAFMLIWEANPRYSLILFPIAIMMLARTLILQQNADSV
ncbi:glycosyltransferase family 39 protein [Lacticaseibacillus porcinae]|uniref:glycosyltransferase family 39 protein n=1 Tax=Lacticaseibacillus porcinae TaxID=1123687 RepID=UPI0013DDAC2E|nr:glycosyltransferase family 39 protein [Lacticaseibacillus porcinae]